MLLEFQKSPIIGEDAIKEPLYHLSKKLKNTPFIKFDL
jgi:hypothetical protein